MSEDKELELAEEKTSEDTSTEEESSPEPLEEESASKETEEESDSSEDEASKEEDSDDDEPEDSDEDDEDSDDEVPGADGEVEVVAAGDDGDSVVPPVEPGAPGPGEIKGLAAFFDLPDDLMLAAAHTRDSEYDDFEAFSPFPIHGMDDAMGLGRSWIPWVTFGAGTAGLITANALQFGTMTFDWPMIIGGKPYAPWPAFVPIMFELTVLLAGVITAVVMLIAAGCFKKPFIIDKEITQDRFAIWISAEDESFDVDEVREFLESLDPVEIRTITRGA